MKVLLSILIAIIIVSILTSAVGGFAYTCIKYPQQTLAFLLSFILSLIIGGLARFIYLGYFKD
jgi:hypothetical protein